MSRETPPESDLEKLLRPHWPELRQMLAFMLSQSRQPAGRDDVDELLSEVIAEALPKFQNYDPSRRIVGWLAGYAINILRRRPREQRKAVRLDSPERLQELLAPQDQYQAQARREMLEKCLGELSAAEQEVICLAYLEEMSGKQLADALGLASVNAAYVKKTRALKKLKEIADRLRREE